MPAFLGLPIQPALPLLPSDPNDTSILPAGPSASSQRNLPSPFAVRKTLGELLATGWAGQLAMASPQGPACPLSGATSLACSSQFHCQLSQKPLTTPSRRFKSRAGLYLQTDTKELNFDMILLSDLQGRF